MNYKREKSDKFKAFTLVELLVVVSIIAMLLAVLIPSLQKSRMKAEQIVCRTHLDQIGKALFMYAQDNRDLFPDKTTIGGFAFRAAPGYKDAYDPRGLPEMYGLAAVLGKSNYEGKSPPGAYLDGQSKVWICPSNGRIKIKFHNVYTPMSEFGNTYAYSTAGMLSYTKTLDLKKRAGNNWLVWDNYTYYPYNVGQRTSGSVTGFTIPVAEQVSPHKWRHKKTTTLGVNVLYFDLHTEIAYNQ